MTDSILRSYQAVSQQISVPSFPRLNLADHTQDFGNTSRWNPQSGTVSTDALVAPDGTTTAERVTTGSGGNSLFSQGAGLNSFGAYPSTTYTSSIYLQAVSGVQWFAIQFSVNISDGIKLWFDILNGVTGSNVPIGIAPTIVSERVEMRGVWARVITTLALPSTAVMMAYDHIPSVSDGGGAVGAGNQYGIWGLQLELGSTVSAYQMVP